MLISNSFAAEEHKCIKTELARLNLNYQGQVLNSELLDRLDDFDFWETDNLNVVYDKCEVIPARCFSNGTPEPDSRESDN